MSRKGHLWILWRFGLARCRRCGLIWLKNAVSDKAARKPCPDHEE